jgi:hypothetical protein
MDKTRTLIILLLLIGAIVPVYFLSKWTQRVLKPRQSLGRLLAWMGLMAVAVFLLTFLLVRMVTLLFPLP